MRWSSAVRRRSGLRSPALTRIYRVVRRAGAVLSCDADGCCTCSTTSDIQRDPAGNDWVRVSAAANSDLPPQNGKGRLTGIVDRSLHACVLVCCAVHGCRGRCGCKVAANRWTENCFRNTMVNFGNFRPESIQITQAQAGVAVMTETYLDGNRQNYTHTTTQPHPPSLASDTHQPPPAAVRCSCGFISACPRTWTRWTSMERPHTAIHRTSTACTLSHSYHTQLHSSHIAPQQPPAARCHPFARAK